jgi:hypothetical protein
MYFVDLLSLSVLSKVDCKISVSFEQIRNFKVLNLAMVKVKKVKSQLPNCEYDKYSLHPTVANDTYLILTRTTEKSLFAFQN